MTPEYTAVDVSDCLASRVGAGGLADDALDALVDRGREIHDDLLLARARGQIGFGDLYLLGREALRAKESAEALAPRFDNVAVLARGAAADVAGAMLGSLSHPFHNLLPRSGRGGRPRVFLVDSIDPDCLAAFLESFALQQTLMVALGRSGEELDVDLQFGIVRDMLRKRLGPGYQDHLVVVTDPGGGTLREEALRDGLLSFEVPANVPARYSALTPVGLFPGALAGLDVRAVLSGAHAAAERTAGEDVRTNPAYRLAATLHLLATQSGRRRVAFAANGGNLGATAHQLSLLFGEAMGFATSSLSLPRDAARLVNTAGDDLTVVQISVTKPSRDRVLPAGPVGLEWLEGRSLSEVCAAGGVATRDALRARGVPVVEIRLPALGANTVGSLHMTCMLAAAFGAGLVGGDLRGASDESPLRRATLDVLRKHES